VLPPPFHVHLSAARNTEKQDAWLFRTYLSSYIVPEGIQLLLRLHHKLLLLSRQMLRCQMYA
jgi:hypothetical protein